MPLPISLVVAVETASNSVAVIDKLGRTGILLTQLLAADTGETAMISFSDEVKVHQEFTASADLMTHSLRMLRPEGSGAHMLDAIRQSLLMLERRPPGQRRIILMIAEKRDRSSDAKLPEIVEQVQRLDATIYWLTRSPFREAFTTKPRTMEDLKPEAERIRKPICAAARPRTTEALRTTPGPAALNSPKPNRQGCRATAAAKSVGGQGFGPVSCELR